MTFRRGLSGDLGLENRLGSRIVTYADDLVILCRHGRADEALLRMREIMEKLKLRVNEDKTRICTLPEGDFDFLGYRFGRLYSPRTGRSYLGAKPSRKSVKRMIGKIRTLTVQSGTGQDTTEVVQRLNRTLRGWAHYYQWGSVSKAYRAIDAYSTMRLRRWLRKKHKVRRNGLLAYPPEYLYQTMGLICFRSGISAHPTRKSPTAKAADSTANGWVVRTDPGQFAPRHGKTGPRRLSLDPMVYPHRLDEHRSVLEAAVPRLHGDFSRNLIDGPPGKSAVVRSGGDYSSACR